MRPTADHGDEKAADAGGRVAAAETRRDDDGLFEHSSRGVRAEGAEEAAEGLMGSENKDKGKSRSKSKNHSRGHDSPVHWRDLPRKGQLAVLTLARLSEPLVQTSLQSYMFYQLKSFRPELADAVIAGQSGVLQASFTATQFLTAMFWGRLADSPRFGRKAVLMMGLGGTIVSCLGFGFSQTFWQALLFRSIGGATNGNVGVLRTMIGETIREKKFQSRAFMILPMTYNIGVIVGPVLGGVLSDPVHSYPRLFGDSAFFQQFPYVMPNLLSAVYVLMALVVVWLGLEETLDSRLEHRDTGLALGAQICALFRARPPGSTFGYTPLATHSRQASECSAFASGGSETARRPRFTQRLPFRRILTRNVVLTLLAQSVYAFHMGTFNSLWFVFLSTPVYDPAVASTASAAPVPPFVFAGGIGLQPRDVGLAMAILGGLGILLQLLLYPGVAARLGTVRSWQLFLGCFPLTYFAVPLLSLVPSRSPPPHAKDGPAIWLAMAAVLLAHVMGRTFALPAQTILVNNSAPHPSVLGTVHGLAQSTSSLARTVGPVAGGYLYGLGLQHGVLGAVFWGLSAVAVAGVVTSLLVREGNGHEIWLEGDDEEEE